MLLSPARAGSIVKRSKERQPPAWRGSRANTVSRFSRLSEARAKIDKCGKFSIAFTSWEEAFLRRGNCCGRERGSWWSAISDRAIKLGAAGAFISIVAGGRG